LREASKSITDELSESVFTRDGTRVLSSERQRIQRLSRRVILSAGQRLEADIEASVSRAIHRAQLAQEDHLRRLGVKGLSASTRRGIREAILRQLEDEFPQGSGLDFRTRIRATTLRHANQIDDFIGRSYISGGARDRIVRDVDRGLTYSRFGRTPVRGGSMFRQARRSQVAEETRLANQAEIVTMGVSGVSFAYWRLSPAHPWYGGQEICEQYASRIVPEVLTVLENAGIQVSMAELEGLHLIRNWPQYPHPYCKCYPEAWVPPQISTAPNRSELFFNTANAFIVGAIATGVLLTDDTDIEPVPFTPDEIEIE
jgi:hypothetical protein